MKVAWRVKIVSRRMFVSKLEVKWGVKVESGVEGVWETQVE